MQPWGPATILTKTPTQVFSCETCEIFKYTFFYGIPPVAGSDSPVKQILCFSNYLLQSYLIHFWKNAPILYLLKTKPLMLWCFREYKIGTMARNVIKTDMFCVRSFSFKISGMIPYRHGRVKTIVLRLKTWHFLERFGIISYRQTNRRVIFLHVWSREFVHFDILFRTLLLPAFFY